MKSALILIYPLLIFLSVRWQAAWLGSLALVGLGGHLLLPSLRRGQRWAVLMMVIIVLTALAVFTSNNIQVLPQLMPVMIFLLLAVFFGRTLVPTSVPLISRIAAAARDIPPDRIRQDMAPEVQRYTWKVTCFWTLMFLVFAIEDLLMLWMAPPMPWPFVINGINLGIMLLLLVGEYLYHSRRYPNPRHKNFLDFIRDVVRFDYHRLLDD